MDVKAKNRRRAELKKIFPNFISLIRFALSVLLLILAYNLELSKTASVVITAFAALIAGSDLLFGAYKAVKMRDPFNRDCIFTISAIAVFCAGCFKEAALFLEAVLLCSVCSGIITEKIKNSALELIPSENKELRGRLRAQLSKTDEADYPNKEKIEIVSGYAVKILAVIALLYAVLLPLISDMTYVMSVRRGAMILTVAAPIGVISSAVLCINICKCGAEAFGIGIKNNSVLSKIQKTKAVVIDKVDVITGGVPKLSAVVSPILDNDSFVMLAAYASAMSEQHIADSIVAAYNGEINPAFIEEFEDIPGLGMEAVIRGKRVLLGTRELFDIRGISLDESSVYSGYVLYLSVSGSFAGCILFNENINPYAEDAVAALSAIGIESHMVSEDSPELCKKTADSLRISSYYPLCDTYKKLSVVKECKQELDDNACLIYISADNADCHSDADIDVLVDGDREAEDILMSNIGIFGLAPLIRSARFTEDVQTQNLRLCLAVKLVSLLLAVFGWSTLWFIALLNCSADVFGLLNILRITDSI